MAIRAVLDTNVVVAAHHTIQPGKLAHYTIFTVALQEIRERQRRSI